VSTLAATALAATVSRLCRDRAAVTALEYAVMLAVMSAVAVVAVTSLSSVLSSAVATLPAMLAP
jgi:Flp pilus assembly pilin Flp